MPKSLPTPLKDLAILRNGILKPEGPGNRIRNWPLGHSGRGPGRLGRLRDILKQKENGNKQDNPNTTN